MRIRVIVRDVEKGEPVVRDVFELPVVYTKEGKFDRLTQSVMISAFAYLQDDKANTVVIEKVL